MRIGRNSFILKSDPGHGTRRYGGTSRFLEKRIDTGLQHDAVLDYYGKRLATCSSDKTVKIFAIEGDSRRLMDTLKGYHLTLLRGIADLRQS